MKHVREDAARRAAPPAGGLGRPGRRDRPRHLQGPGAPLRIGRRAHLRPRGRAGAGDGAGRLGERGGHDRPAHAAAAGAPPPAPAGRPSRLAGARRPARRRGGGRPRHPALAVRRSGAPARRARRSAQDLVPISLKQSAAKDYDPYGSGGEHPDQTGLVVDRDTRPSGRPSATTADWGASPAWASTSTPRPAWRRRRCRSARPTPGFTAAVYAADSGPPEDISGWTVVAPARTVTEQSATLPARPPRPRTATTSSGSPSCPRARRRSPRSTCPSDPRLRLRPRGAGRGTSFTGSLMFLSRRSPANDQR